MKLVLDFGAGWKAVHAEKLKQHGWNVLAWDFGRNFDSKVHHPRALDLKYEIVYASNVLNVQSTEHALRGTIAQLASVTHPKYGVCFCNYPKAPRKADFSAEKIRFFLSECFYVVRDLRYRGNTIWGCSAPKTASVFFALNGFKFTDKEIEIANIRPSGAVGRDAIVPRFVETVLESGVWQ